MATPELDLTGEFGFEQLNYIVLDQMTSEHWTEDSWDRSERVGD